MTYTWEKQKEVESFIRRYELEGSTEFRILDLFSDVGEIAKDATKSADYGNNPDEIRVKHDEIGDALFSLIAVANDLDMDIEEALNQSLEKYRKRIGETGDPGSG